MPCRRWPAATLRPATATAKPHPVIPFKALHTAVGAGSVGLACLLAFGAIFDVGLKAFAAGESVTRVLYRWIPLGVNQAVGQIPGGRRRVGRRRRLPARRALGAHARVRDVRRLPHPRLLGRVHGPRGGLRALLRVPEPLHVRDARPRAGRELPDALRRMGGRGPLLVPSDRLLLREEVRGRRGQEGLRRQPDRRLRLHPRHLRRLRALRLARFRDGLRGGGREPGRVRART